MKRPVAAAAICLALSFGGATCVRAQVAGGCSSDKSHEFDFWVGEWVVTANGGVAGHNRIEPILNGCVIQETWDGAGGSAGSSFNFFNPQMGKWQQFWVWRNGTTLYLTGDYADGKMILEGESVTQQADTVMNRITWFDNEDGTVRQLWESSADDGETWAVGFDGLYTRHEESDAGQ